VLSPVCNIAVIAHICMSVRKTLSGIACEKDAQHIDWFTSSEEEFLELSCVGGGNL